jgi:hypothetical protein
MHHLYSLVALAIWTLFCAILVSGLERLGEAFGYKVEHARLDGPPPPADQP